MAMQNIVLDIGSSIEVAITQTVGGISLANIAGAIIVLIIGWIAGRLIGKAVSKILDKVGVDDAVRKTVFGKALEKSGITVVKFFDYIFRWFIYLIAVLAAVDILKIAVLSEFMQTVVEYLPSFIGGVFILVFGFIIVDFLGDMISAVGREAKLEFSGIIAVGLKLMLYFVVLVVALQLMRIDVEILYIFANAAAWGLALGIGAGLGIALGWGFKDTIARNSRKWLVSLEKTAKTAEKSAEKQQK
jgi:hypothetical protein